LARSPYPWGYIPAEVAVPMEELNSAVDEFLLAEDSKLISTERVDIGLEEGIICGIVLNIILDLVDCVVVGYCL